jgi:hypothetical protein
MGLDPNQPELVHPFASAIDTPLPKPPERDHIMLDYAAPWCEVPAGPNECHFHEFPDESLARWHQRQGLLDGPRSGCDGLCPGGVGEASFCRGAERGGEVRMEETV